MASFTVLVWCSDELAVHSCLLFRLQTRTLRNLPAHCSTVALCWVTITWQRIFKGSLHATIGNTLFRMCLLTSDMFDRWCSDTVTQWSIQPKIFLGAKIWGAKMFDFRRATVFSLGYCLSKCKMTTFWKKIEGMAPWDTLFHMCETNHEWNWSKNCNRWQKVHLRGKIVYSSTWKRSQNRCEWSACFHGALSLWCRNSKAFCERPFVLWLGP